MAEGLFYALLTGIVLGVVYDIFRFFRLTFNSNFFLDFLFWILTAFATFSFLLVFNNGEIRAIYFLLFFVGFVFYIFTLGYVTKGVEEKFAKLVKIWLKKVKNKLKSFKKVLHFVNDVYYNIKVKVLKLFGKKTVGDKDGKK
ncbi:MAG: spore cortex biosynthesis protein YabQ [Eubacterium sp.]